MTPGGHVCPVREGSSFRALSDPPCYGSGWERRDTMSAYIGKFNRNGTDYYFDYSTATGTLSRALVLEEYRERYGKLHGQRGLVKLVERLQRADAKGTSAYKKNGLDDMLKGNR